MVRLAPSRSLTSILIGMFRASIAVSDEKKRSPGGDAETLLLVELDHSEDGGLIRTSE